VKRETSAIFTFFGFRPLRWLSHPSGFFYEICMYSLFVPYVMCACLLPHVANSVRRRVRIYKWWQSDIKFTAPPPTPTLTTPPSPTAAAAPWIKFTLRNQMLSVSQEVLRCTQFNWLLREWVSLCIVCFQVCTNSIRLKTVRASDCRSTPRIASTVKRAISRIPVRISTGWCPREEEDQPITACKCGWGAAKQLKD